MQQVISGINCISGLFHFIKEKGEKIVIAVGRHALKENWFAEFISSLDKPPIVIHPPDGLLTLTEVPIINKPDILIAIGGGKTIDFAKAVLNNCLSEGGVLFIAVPTTAGSGSEATPFAVVYSGKEKQTLENVFLLPRVVFLDGSLMNNLSPKQKAISGADAFSQCIESLWNVHGNGASDLLALKGLDVLFNSLPRFVTSSDGPLSQEILEAANLSGKAIATTRTTGPHALSYYLTSHHNVAHGQAVALFLPLFFLYNEAKINPAIYKALNVSNAPEAFATVTDFFCTLGLATNFAELELDDIDVNALLQSVNHQRFSNNPVPYNEGILHSLIHQYLA